MHWLIFWCCRLLFLMICRLKSKCKKNVLSCCLDWTLLYLVPSTELLCVQFTSHFYGLSEPLPGQTRVNEYLQTLQMTSSSGLNTAVGPIAHVADCRNPESFSLRSVCEHNRLLPKHGPAELRATRCLTRGEFQLRFKTWPWTRSTRYVLFAYSLADTPVWCSPIECAKSRLRSSGLEMTYKSKSATLLTLSPGEGPRAPSTT